MIVELISLEPCHHHIVSGMLLACCLQRLKQTYYIDFKEEIRIKLIQLMTLSVTDGDQGLEYLLSMVKESDNKAK